MRWQYDPCAVLCCAVLCCAVLCCAVLCCGVVRCVDTDMTSLRWCDFMCVAWNNFLLCKCASCCIIMVTGKRDGEVLLQGTPP